MPRLCELQIDGGYLVLDRLDVLEVELLWGLGWEDQCLESAIVRFRGLPCFARVLPEGIDVARPTDAWRQYLLIGLDDEQFQTEQTWHNSVEAERPEPTDDYAARAWLIRRYFDRREANGRRARPYEDNEVLGWLDGLPGTGLRRIIPRTDGILGSTGSRSGPGSGAGGWLRPVPNRHRARWVYDDILADPDDPQLYEIIDGELIPHLGHSLAHQTVLGPLAAGLHRLVAVRKLGVAFHGPYDVVLTSGDVLQPDLMAWLKPLREAARRGVVPDMVMEIVDSTTRARDLGRKRDHYAVIGVREYWLVDAEERTISVLGPCDGALVERPQVEAVVRSAVVPGFVVDPAEVFAELDEVLTGLRP